MNVPLRGTSAESLPGWVRSRTSCGSSPEREASIDPSTDALMQSTHTDGTGAPVQAVVPVRREQTHTRPRLPRAPWMGLGLAMYSQKLLFSLRCPLELFGLYRSLVCRIYLGTCPWAPCRSRHPPGGRLVRRWSERMERGEKEEEVSTCQEERATSCLSFWRKCTVSFEISMKFINGQYYLQKAS